jgi:hypothetical protein
MSRVIDEIREYVNNQEYLLAEEMPIALLLEIYDRLGEVLENLQVQAPYESPVRPSSPTPDTIGIQFHRFGEALEPDGTVVAEVHNHSGSVV